MCRAQGVKWQLETGWGQTVTNPRPHWGVQSHRSRDGPRSPGARSGTDTSSCHTDSGQSRVGHGGEGHRSRAKGVGEGALGGPG